MVFLLSQLVNGAKSSLHKINKPNTVLFNEVKYLSKPLQNSAGIPIQKTKIQIQESLRKAIKLPRLNKIQQAVGKAFSQPKNQINFPNYLSKTQDAEEYYLNNTRITKRTSLIEANPYTAVDYRYNSSYSQPNISSSHVIKEFTSEDHHCENLSGLISFFLNSNKPIKLQKTILSSNLNEQKKDLTHSQSINAKSIFDMLDPHHANTTVIKNIKLIDKDLSLNLANNKQRLIVHNGSKFYVLIPRLENNNITNTSQVFWHFVSEDNLSAIYSYSQLNENQKKLYTHSQFINIWKYGKLVNADDFKITQHKLQRLELQENTIKRNISNLTQEFLKHNNIQNLSLYNPLQEANQALISCTEELIQARIKLDLLKNKLDSFNALEKNTKDIIDILSRYAITYNNEFSHISKEYLLEIINQKVGNNLTPNQKNIIYRFILACSNQFNSKIITNSNFSLHDILSFIQQNNTELTITASKISKIRHKFYPSLIRPKTSDLAKTYTLQQVTANTAGILDQNSTNINTNNKSNENLLNAISGLLGKSIEEFSSQNPAVARNILDGINKKHGLKDLIRASGEHVDRYDLTNIYKNQSNIDSKKRKNGGSLLNGPIQAAIANKKTMLVELNSKLQNPFVSFEKPVFFSLNYEYNGRQWYAQELKNGDMYKVSDPSMWMANQSKSYNADLYLQRDKEAIFSRDVYRCKFKKNISTPSLDLYDKLIKHKSVWKDERADIAINNIYKGIKLRNYVAGEYKLKVKPNNNVVTRFFNAYINPFSVENSGARKAGHYFRNAAYNHEDSGRRYWGFFKGGVGQPQDTLPAHIAIVAGLSAEHPAFTDATVQYAFHQGMDFFAQLVADAIQPLSYHTMAKYGHLFNISLGKTAKEIRHDISNLKKIINNNLKLLDSVNIDKDKNIYIDGKLIKNKEEAQQIIKGKLLEAFVALLALVAQSKAQDKTNIAIAFIDQFFQNLLGRAGYFAMAVFAPGAEHAPVLKKLYRVIRRAIQTPLAGVDNINRQMYLDTTHIYIPSHMMTDRALKYNIDKYVGKISQAEFEKNVIRIMIDNYETHYTEQDFARMSKQKLDNIISRFLIDPSKVHNNAVSYNIERRIDIIQSYIIELYAEHRKLEYQYKQKIIELNNSAKTRKLSTKEISDKKYYESQLNFTQEKISTLKQEEILFHQGLQYNKDINSNPLKKDHINWQYSWGTLQKNYPNGFLAEFLNPKDPMPVIKKKLKLLFKQPNEALMHIFFRSSNSSILATDEVATSVSTQVEATQGGLAAQLIVMGLLSTTFTAGISAGIVRYFENAATFGKPRGHFMYVCAMIWAVDKKLSDINREMSSLSNSNILNANDEKNETKFNELLKNAQALVKIKEFLENDAKPKVSINRLTNTTKNLNRTQFYEKAAEFLATSVSSLIPRKEDSKLNGFRTDENRILDIMNSAKHYASGWYKTQSVVYPIAERLKGKFGKSNPNIDENRSDNLNMFNTLFQQFISQAQTDVNVSYKYMIENLFNKIPNSANITNSESKIKVDYAIHRREFITKMQSLSNELSIILKDAVSEFNEDYKNNEESDINLEYLHNLQNFKFGIDKFIKAHENIGVPNAIEYINLNDIKATENGEIFFNKVNSKQDINYTNNSDDKIKIDLSSSYMWSNWNNYGGLENTPNDSNLHKALSRIKKASSFTYKYILPITNPLNRRFLPTMYLQNAITTPVVAWDKIHLVHEVRDATYVAQKAINNIKLQTIIEDDIQKLSIGLNIVNAKIAHFKNNQSNNNQNSLNRLASERAKITKKREELLLNTSQIFRVNDKLPKQIFKIGTLGKSTKFEQDAKVFLDIRANRLSKTLTSYKYNHTIYSI